MIRRISRQELTLKSLELFQICAQKGSLQATAAETGISVSTVSHHLRNLEEHLGVELFNHARRPMMLTPKGQVFLRNIETVLLALRKATAEASSGDIAEASYLRLGTIEDFDSDITPELAVSLSRQMPRCDFLYETGDSHKIIEQLHNRQLDLGIVTNPSERLGDLQERPLLREPYVIVSPAEAGLGFEDLAQTPELPFLRFSSSLIVARQIEAQLRRMGLNLPRRFECDSNQTLLAMVANGAGWSITTPLLFARARRFHPRLRVQPFPGKRFSRTVSIISTPDCSRSVLDLIEGNMRDLLHRHAIAPLTGQWPWLADSLRLHE